MDNAQLNWRRTKVIATIGPACDSYDDIYQLIKLGTNAFRFNFSHGDNKDRTRQFKMIRKASKELNKSVAIIQDLQGPKIRLGDFEGQIKVFKGQTIVLAIDANYQKEGDNIPIQYDLSKKVKRGERILFSDGRIQGQIATIKDNKIYVDILNNGILLKRKGINVPDTDFGGEVITAKDRNDLVYGSSIGFDYVCLSFVQVAEDINALRLLMNNMNYAAKIIAKIETKSAIDNLESIIQETDAVMVARGDLAVEVPAESVPIFQRQIIGLGQKYAKPTIVATQMLYSMIEQSEPSRAEVSDIATAVLVGADCLMLSDETAVGKYPIQAIKTMLKVINYTEQHSPLTVSFSHITKTKDLQEAISLAILELAESINARAIVAETRSGATALHIAAKRPSRALIAVTSDLKTANQLAIVYAVLAYRRPVDRLAASKLTDWLREHKVFVRGDIIVSVSGKYPGVVGTTDTIKVRML